jgi:hypothetical protein
MTVEKVIRNSDGSANIELNLTQMELEVLVSAGFTKILEDYIEGVDNADDSERNRGGE